MGKCNNMKDIILIGGGGHCKSVIDVIEQEGQFKIKGIVDKPELLGTNVLGYSVIGNDSNLDSLAKKYQYALITVGQIKSPALRINLFNMVINSGFKLPTIISPRAYVSKHSTLGNGVVVMHDALINANVKIGDNSITVVLENTTPSGMYFVSLKSPNGTQATKRIVHLESN